VWPRATPTWAMEVAKAMRDMSLDGGLSWRFVGGRSVASLLSAWNPRDLLDVAFEFYLPKRST